jgi:hypothetical protein
MQSNIITDCVEETKWRARNQDANQEKNKILHISLAAARGAENDKCATPGSWKGLRWRATAVRGCRMLPLERGLREQATAKGRQEGVGGQSGNRKTGRSWRQHRVSVSAGRVLVGCGATEGNSKRMEGVLVSLRIWKITHYNMYEPPFFTGGVLGSWTLRMPWGCSNFFSEAKYKL